MKRTFLAIAAMAAALLCAAPQASLAQATTANTLPGNIYYPGGTTRVQPAPSALIGYNAADGSSCVVGAVAACSLSVGDATVIANSPAVSTSAYSAGDVMGTKLTLAGVTRVSGGSGLIQEVMLSFKSAQTAPADFFFCFSDPSASTFTDNGAVAVAAADFAKCRAIHVTDCTSMGTPSVCSSGNLAIPFILPSGTSAYGFLVTRGTPTLASTSDLTVHVRVLRN